ncbi:MAG: hypothetical protein EA401_00065 [Planctomycetota bacterium]|nr:MAG: hypothetical protein EA401_00065 [Planctomycetota bacterium]
MAKSHWRLQSIGFKAPGVIQYAERKRWGIIRESYFVCEYVPGQPVDDASLSLVVASLQRLYRLGYTRRDPRLRNFIIHQGEVVYIDVGVGHPWLFRRLRCYLEFVRFLNLEPKAQEFANPQLIASWSYRFARTVEMIYRRVRSPWTRLRRSLK